MRVAEFDDAVDYYERENPGLGAKFTDEEDAGFTRIRKQPVVAPNVRKLVLARFPYTLVYEVRDGFTRFWQSRINTGVRTIGVVAGSRGIMRLPKRADQLTAGRAMSTSWSSSSPAMSQLRPSTDVLPITEFRVTRRLRMMTRLTALT
jgi:hypothetical protein